jgi:hypothetical protein
MTGGELLRAGTVEGVAILARMAKMPVPRVAGVAFAGLGADQAVRAMRKPLELECGKSVVRE